MVWSSRRASDGGELGLLTRGAHASRASSATWFWLKVREAGEVPALHELGHLGDELGHVLDTHLELGCLVDVAQAAQPV